jgi:hypothetical protein
VPADLQPYVVQAAAAGGVDLSPERAALVARALERLLAALDGLEPGPGAPPAAFDPRWP